MILLFCVQHLQSYLFTLVCNIPSSEMKQKIIEYHQQTKIDRIGTKKET